MVRRLLAAGYDLHSTDMFNLTPIYLAARQRHGDTIKALISGDIGEEGSSIVAFYNGDPCLLHAIAFLGDNSLVRDLLKDLKLKITGGDHRNGNIDRANDS